MFKLLNKDKITMNKIGKNQIQHYNGFMAKTPAMKEMLYW